MHQYVSTAYGSKIAIKLLPKYTKIHNRISNDLGMPEPVTTEVAPNGEMDEKAKEKDALEVKVATEEEAKKAEAAERSAKGALSLLAVIILASAYLVAFCSRLFAVIRFESIIHEFDPW